ncbi:MAG: thioredoxin family protein [Gammaproteobacteria bacterium]|nr:thioredoxin family protein [Gammaproteobacteria bacterium]
MALTASTMLPLGTKAPEFTLIDTVTGKENSLSSLRSDLATVIVFSCNHCPYVKHIQTEFLNTVKKYQEKGVTFVAINSNNVIRYPDDAPEKMHDLGVAQHYTFPYLYDETQAVAKAYHAACTPDFYVFDKNLSLVYRGRFDASTPGNTLPVTGEDLGAALDAVLASQPISPHQHPSYGCNIKWK